MRGHQVIPSYIYDYIYIIHGLGSLWYIFQAWDTVTLGQSNLVFVVKFSAFVNLPRPISEDHTSFGYIASDGW